MAGKKVALVTGANKGLGLAIVRGLSKRYPASAILLGARDRGRGDRSVSQLLDEGCVNVDLVAIDVVDDDSISKAEKIVAEKFGELNVLVNNAGIATKGSAFDGDIAERTIATNYFGVLNVTNQFLPLLVKARGIIVNISSSSGARALALMSKERREQFLDANLTIDRLTGLMNEFVTDVKNGEWTAKGWPTQAYGVSKAGVSMLTRIMARDHPDLVINCCCPGWVKTDMTGSNATLTPDQGAITPLALCDPSNKRSGLFWRSEKPTDWID